MIEGEGNTVGIRYWMEPEFQGKPSLLRHIPRAGRVTMTWSSPQSIRKIYGDHVPCISTVSRQECKKWPFPQGLDYEIEDRQVC